jgi:hypothetical protein
MTCVFFMERGQCKGCKSKSKRKWGERTAGVRGRAMGLFRKWGRGDRWGRGARGGWQGG